VLGQFEFGLCCVTSCFSTAGQRITDSDLELTLSLNDPSDALRRENLKHTLAHVFFQRLAMTQDLPDKELVTERNSKGFWDVFGRALRAEPRDYLTIRGSSGLDHFVEAIFVDDKSKRVIIVSAEPNPRIAALMQVDVQAAFPDARVLVARPIAFDIAAFARQMVQQFGLVNLPLNVLTDYMNTIAARKDSLFSGFTFQKITLPIVNQILAAIHQLALLDWRAIMEGFKQHPPSPCSPWTVWL
jgi:hypothetical protein